MDHVLTVEKAIEILQTIQRNGGGDLSVVKGARASDWIEDVQVGTRRDLRKNDNDEWVWKIVEVIELL